VSDLLPLGAPSYEELAAHQLQRFDADDASDESGRPVERCGKYRLRARIR
jgi:hypothetical protein